MTRHIPTRFVSVLALAYAAAVYMTVPGTTIPGLGVVIWSVGLGESLAEGSFFAYPSHMGYPIGSPIVFGLPFSYLQAVVMRAVGANAMDAYSVAGLVFLAAALAGAAHLARRLGLPAAWSVVCGALFVTSPFVWYHTAYGPLCFAFALVPAYVTLLWKAVDLVQRAERVGQLLAGAALACATTTFALFMDGYSFVMLTMIWAVIVCHYTWEKRHRGRIALALVAMWACASGVAYYAYKAYLPADVGFQITHIDVFRAMSVDLITLLQPQRGYYALYDLVGLSTRYQNDVLYGDGSNRTTVFLGFAALVACFGFVRSALPRRLKWLLLAAAAAGFILALGPSLQLGATRVVDSKLPRTMYMPESAAIMELPTASLFHGVPGIENMRAVYRWMLIPKFIVWLFAISAVGALLTDKRRWGPVLAGLLLILLLLDGLNPFWRRLPWARAARAQMIQLGVDVIEPLSHYLHRDDKVLFLPTGNDFFVTYAAPKLGIRAYNAGGDKDVYIARLHWPGEVRRINRSTNRAGEVLSLMDRGELDFVVLPAFDMLAGVHRWPSLRAPREQVVPISIDDFDRERFDRFEGGHFSIIGRKGSLPASESSGARNEP